MRYAYYTVEKLKLEVVYLQTSKITINTNYLRLAKKILIVLKMRISIWRLNFYQKYLIGIGFQ